mmetsp:Transcript_55003/g.100649  ORF Transcript_55003/g.100649 Transcript_55003/m.100649 type:complete len:117 (+) Transcript_55003:971-1321(+)
MRFFSSVRELRSKAGSAALLPRQIEEAPPGGALTYVVRVSVMKLPRFCWALLANLLELSRGYPEADFRIEAGPTPQASKPALYMQADSVYEAPSMHEASAPAKSGRGSIVASDATL